MTWEPLNLASPEYAVDPEPPHPDFNRFLYPKKRHLISAPTESLKTLFVLVVALDAIRAGRRVAYLDFEMGPEAARRLLVDLGATDDELAAVYYVDQPAGAPAPDDIDNIVAHGVELLVIDASLGAFHASGLDDNKRQDVEAFAARWVTPLWQRGIATVVLDHVTKSTEGRGKYAIGSERKVGQVDVHLGLEVAGTTPLTRGGNGLLRVIVHKDRPGFLRRPTAAEIALASDPETHRITWEIRAATGATATGEWRPTRYMERVSRHVEQYPAGLNRTAVYRDVTGKRDRLVQAVGFLVEDGYLHDDGTTLTVTKPYRDASHVPAGSLPVPVPEPAPGSLAFPGSQAVPGPFPDAVPPSVPSVPPPIGGDGERGNLTGELELVDVPEDVLAEWGRKSEMGVDT